MSQSNDMTKNKTISVIGLGQFGSLAASILKNHARVVVYSANKVSLAEKALKIGVEAVELAEAATADVVILTVPISKTEDMIRQVVPLMKPGALLLDACSVKVYPCEWLEKYGRDDIEIMGTHPMFGPVSAKFDIEQQSFELAGLQIILCPLRIAESRLELITALLEKLGLDVIVTTPEDHDRQNAITLSLVHFLGRSLHEAGINKQRIYTPGFENLLKIYGHTIKDEWQLFFDMNNYNPFAAEVRQKFLAACQTIENKINDNHDLTFKKTK